MAKFFKLTFNDLLRQSFYVNFVFGFNLNPDKKHNTVCNILFIHTICMVLYSLLYSVLQAELRPDDVQKTLLSIFFIQLAICLVFMTVSQKLNIGIITKLLKDSKDLFHELPFRDELESKFNLRIIIGVFAPMFIIIHHFIRLVESMYSKDSVVSYGNERFDQLCAKYPIQEMYNFWGCLARNVTGQCMCVIFVPVSMLIDNAFLKLCVIKKEDLITSSSGSENSVDAIRVFIRIHSKTCQLLKLLDKLSKYTNLWFASIMLSNLIFKARTIFSKQYKLSHDHIFSVTLYFVMFMGMILEMSKLQAKCRKSLSNLMEMAADIEKDQSSSMKTTTNALQLKTDLYITSVELDNPSMTLGGLLTFNNHLIVSVLNFSLSYIFLLYNLN
ncbi:hypothetical protein CHUAL_011221 [Chamberlinius hualienensis]